MFQVPCHAHELLEIGTGADLVIGFAGYLVETVRRLDDFLVRLGVHLLKTAELVQHVRGKAGNLARLALGGIFLAHA